MESELGNKIINDLKLLDISDSIIVFEIGDYHINGQAIKRIVNKYFHADNMYSFTIIGNSHFKKWYHGTIMFIATNFIFPFWNPFIEM